MVMMGEAFRIQVSLTAGFRDDLLGSVLERRNPETSERVDELAPGQAGDLSRPALRDDPYLQPLHGGGEAHLPRESLRIFVEGGQGAFGDFDRHADHGFSLAYNHPRYSS